jgi:hypothetical protein
MDEISDGRFAVKRRDGTVVGHVIDNRDGTWCIELQDKVIEVVYRSFRCATDAILELNPLLH